MDTLYIILSVCVFFTVLPFVVRKLDRHYSSSQSEKEIELTPEQTKILAEWRSSGTTASFVDWKRAKDRVEASNQKRQRLRQLVEIGLLHKDEKRDYLHWSDPSRDDELGILPEEAELLERLEKLHELLPRKPHDPLHPFRLDPEYTRLKAKWDESHLTIQKELASLYVKVNDDFYADAVEEIQSRPGGRPFKVSFHDETTCISDRRPWTGRWMATSYIWGEMTPGKTLVPMSEIDYSKNAAIAKLDQKVKQSAEKVQLPFDPMNADC